MTKLSETDHQVCNEYVRQFCGFVDVDPRYCFWIGDKHGGVLDVGDGLYDVNYEDIRYIVDCNNGEDRSANGAVTKPFTLDEFNEWYEYGTAACTYGMPHANIVSWHHGCPHVKKSQITVMAEYDCMLSRIELNIRAVDNPIWKQKFAERKEALLQEQKAYVAKCLREIGIVASRLNDGDFFI